MRENMSTLKCHIGLDARKFSSAKISTFTVYCKSVPIFAANNLEQQCVTYFYFKFKVLYFILSKLWHRPVFKCLPSLGGYNSWFDIVSKTDRLFGMGKLLLYIPKLDIDFLNYV